MLIACYQCRQQLDVPEELAGKRVHCPHCQHVIVVPAKARESAAGSIQAQTPALGMPSMELDVEGEGEKPTTTKVPAQPLPPLDLPSVAELPPLPSVERGPRRRRAPIGSAPPSNVRWGYILTGGALLFGLLAFCLVRGLKEPNHPAVELPPFAAPFNGEIQPPPGFIAPPAQNQVPPGQFNPQVGGVGLPWQDFYSAAHRFKVRFPGPVTQRQQAIAGKDMTVFEAKHGEWEFSVAHRDLSAQEFNEAPLAKHFQALRDALNVRADVGFPLNLAGRHPGREWLVGNFGADYVQAFFVRAENGHSQYLLRAKGPFGADHQDAAFLVFFNNFFVLPGSAGDNAHVGQTVYEDSDDANNVDRRANEFTALALQRGKPLAVVGAASSVGQVLAIDGRQRIVLGNHPARNERAIEQLAISADGEKLAIVSGGDIQVLRGWEGGAGKEDCHLPGIRCAFTKDRQLLVLTRDGIGVRDRATGHRIALMEFPAQSVDPATVQGLALSGDERTLAVFSAKTIALWQWPEKNLLGRCDAQGAPITAVAFSPDGKTLASAGADRTIRLWDLATRKERATLRQHAWTVAALAFTPDGKRLASAGLDGMLLLWDLEPETPALIWAQANRFPVRAVAFDAEGKHCYLTCKQASQGEQKEGREYVRRLRKIAVADMKPNPDQAAKIVAQCAGLHLPISAGTVWIARAAKTIVTTSDRLDFAFNNVNPPAQTRIWDGVTARQRLAMPALAGSVLSPDGKWLAFSRPGPKAEVRVMATTTMAISQVLLQRESNSLDNIFFTPDGKSLWVLDKHALIRYAGFDRLAVAPVGIPFEEFKVDEQQRVNLKEPTDPRSIDIALALDQQSFLVNLTNANGGFRKRTLHAMADGKELPMPKFAAGERSQFLRLRKFDIDGIELEDFLRGQAQVIGRQWQVMTPSAIDPDGKLAVTEASEKDEVLKLHFWDLSERRPLLTLPDAGARIAHAVRFSADGRFIACVTNAGWTRITPIDWLTARQTLLRCDPDEAAPP